MRNITMIIFVAFVAAMFACVPRAAATPSDGTDLETLDQVDGSGLPDAWDDPDQNPSATYSHHLPGDTDADGDVDASDLATLGMNWSPGGSDGAWSMGDFDGDGDVDASDLAALGMNWSPGGYVPPMPPMLPEPLTILAVGGGLVYLGRYVRKSRTRRTGDHAG